MNAKPRSAPRRWALILLCTASLLWACGASVQRPTTAIPDFYVLSADGRDGQGVANDDTPHFVDVLDLMRGAQNGILQLPEGIFVLHRSGSVDDPLTIDLDGITIQGVGKSNRLTTVDSTGAWLHRGTEIWLTANPIDQGATGIIFGGKADSSMTTGLTVRDLTIRSSVTNRLGNAIVMQNLEDCYFENVDFYTTRVSGANGDHYYAGVLLTYVGRDSLENQTANVTFSNCHFWQPGPGGGSGIGQALKLMSPTYKGGVRQNNFINCKFSGFSFDENLPRPSRTGDVILFQGDCEECGNLGEVANNTFVGCAVSGHAKINFCAAHRNKWMDGIIDVNPAIGDTAYFANYESTDNIITGSIDGRRVDEQQNPSSKVTTFDFSSEAGPLFRALQLMPHSTSQIPVALSGETFFDQFIPVYAAADTFLLWIHPNGTKDTLAVR